jgi:hypothetical protein
VAAESHPRIRQWGVIAAFTLIVVEIGEGIDQGFEPAIACAIRS